VSLHRLLGFDAAVPDPDTLSAYYAELGLSGDASSGFTGSDGGASVTLAEGPFRRLDSVSVGCEDESDLAAIAGRVEAGGAVARIADGVLAVVDPATRVRFEVRVADATPVTFLWLTLNFSRSVSAAVSQASRALRGTAPRRTADATRSVRRRGAVRDHRLQPTLPRRRVQQHERACEGSFRRGPRANTK